jgi:hypothetical protein
MKKKTDLYDKVTWYLMASAGLAMWLLIAYAVYEVSSVPSPFK